MSQLIADLWELTAAKGLKGLTIEEIIQKTGLEAAEARRLFPTQSAILKALIYDIDQSVVFLEPGATSRESLFDAIMAYFDGLQAHRQGVVQLYKDLNTPCETPLLLELRDPYLQMVERIMHQAGIEMSGLTGWGKTQVMAVFGLWLLSEWVRDETPDLSATMASLDKGLGRLEELNQLLAGFC